MKNILFMFHNSDLYSGATKSLIDMIDSLTLTNQYRIFALFPDRNGSAINYIKNIGIQTFYVPYRWDIIPSEESKISKLILFIKRLTRHIINIICAIIINDKVINKNSINIVYNNTSAMLLGCYIRRVNRSIKNIVHFREFGDLDQNHTYFLGKKYCFYMINKYCDYAIYISNALSEYYRKNINVKYSVVYNDISPDYIQYTECSYRTGNPLQILMIGVVSEGKGQFQVVKAMKNMSDCNVDFHLYFAGRIFDKEYYKKIDQYIKLNALEKKITFLGEVSNINDIRKNANVCVVASIAEAFGRVTIEGMLSKLLIIASNKGANLELIIDGETGYLYNYNEPREISKILQDIYYGKINSEKVEQVRVCGFKYALNFTRGIAAKSISNIFDSL